MKLMNIITIDCGASFIKASRFYENKIRNTIKIPTPPDNDLNKLSKSIEIIYRIIEDLSNVGEELHLGFSNEMHGFVLTDINGKALTPYISWQKEYSENSHFDINRKIEKSDIIKSGMPIKKGLPSVNLYHCLLKKNFDKNTSLYFYTLGDYYIRLLSGKQPYIHKSNAAATGLYDLESDKWNEKMINEIIGKKNIIFPKIYTNQNTIKCEILNRTVYLYPALGDQQAALYGSGLSDEKVLSLNFGTGAQMSVLLSAIEFSDNYQVRPYFKNKYIKTIPHIPSGRAINVYFNFIKEIIKAYNNIPDNEIWDYINNEVLSNQKELLNVDLSFFTNAITDSCKASISNIYEDGFTVGNLFESIYMQFIENINTIYNKLGKPEINKIIISGGVINKNSYLKNKISELFNYINDIEYAQEETAKGIAKYILNYKE